MKRALAAYTAIAILATWPLALGLGRDVAWDLGDPVLNIWIVAWDCEQLLAALRGHVDRLWSLFDANIFYPAPLTLAFSEHLLPQAIQALPIYALTHNPILVYNLLFLSTFILSGLGGYLFVRALTGDAIAGFAGGLLFAFAPYRLPQSSHIQVLSSQWMPFALYALHRYFDAIAAGSDRVRATAIPLAGAGAALVLQNLSCGYYIFYFSPFVAVYVIWEIVRRGLWRQIRVWVHIAALAASVLIATVPFLLPYLALHDQLQFSRSRPEVMRYSADIYSYATAFVEQPIWGRVMDAYHKPEGELFPGLVTIALALIGLFTWRASAAPAETSVARRRWALALTIVAALHLIAFGAVLVSRRMAFDLGPFELRISNATQLLLRATVALAAACGVSRALRARVRAFVADRGFFLLAWLAAAWFSFGPAVQALGRPVDLIAPYGWLFDHVPGFDGVRAPARLAMVGTLMLAVLGAYGARAIGRTSRGRYALAALGILFLAESVSLPFTVNGSTPVTGYHTPPARIERPSRAPAVYAAVTTLPSTAVLAELPLGPPDFDLRAMYYSIVHGRRLLNGYSGYFPAHYGGLMVALSDVPGHPRLALDALRRSGATHAIVHEDAYLDEEGRKTTAALRNLGAVEVYRDATTVLLRLPT